MPRALPKLEQPMPSLPWVRLEDGKQFERDENIRVVIITQ
jgi:hypothetical protein